MATPTKSTSSSSKHLWVCDTMGGVHVLTYVTTEGTKRPMWREVSGAMDRVMCGTSGSPSIICGIRNNQLFLRSGVSPSKPIGESWAKTRVEAVEVAIGSRYLVTRNTRNEIHALKINKFATSLRKPSTEIALAGWEDIEKKSFLSLLIMDSADNLYGFSTKGDVYTCGRLIDQDHIPSWGGKVKGSPSNLSVGSLINSVSSLFSRTSSNAFSMSAVGDGCLWCVQTSPPSLWQLVLPPSSQSGSDRWKWSNWVKFTFSDNEMPAQVCGNPQSNSELFAISKARDTVTRLFLSSSTVEFQELPFHGCGDINLSSLSLSIVEESTTPSIYPEVPSDICCENGECSFCQKMSDESLQETTSSPSHNEELRMYLKRGRSEHSPAKQARLYSPSRMSHSGVSPLARGIAGTKRSSTIRLDVDDQFYTCFTSTYSLAVKKRKTGTL